MRKRNLISMTLICFISFCTIQAQTYKQRAGSKKISIRKAPKYPPYLEALVSFHEPSGNQFLDAEESGRITVTIKNSGKGRSDEIGLNISARGDDGINYSRSHNCAEISPGQERMINIPISASFSVQSKEVSMIFNFSEKNGFEPDQARLTFETKKYKRPILVLVDGLDIDDSNNNGMVESGELVTITAAVQNIGKGIAKSVIAKLSKGENVFFGGDSKTEFFLGTLKPGDLKKLTFEVYTNKKADAIPVYIDVNESKGIFGLKKTELPLEFKRRIPKINEVQVVGIDNGEMNISLASGFRIDVEENIPVSEMNNKNALAIIFGLETYKNVSPVTFAKRDATYIKEYFQKVLGIPNNRIYFKTDDDVSQAEFRKVFSKGGWLDKRIKKNRSNIYFYFVGHGAPNINDKKGYLIPYDGDPNYASQTGYALDDLYKELNRMSSKSTTVFLDACFSGVNRNNEMLLANARPVFLEVDNSFTDKVNVFSAAGGKQIASSWPEKKHGLFSYFLMKGMRGDADKNGDRKLTYGELGKYLEENVSSTAGLLDREQTPSLSSQNENSTFIAY